MGVTSVVRTRAASIDILSDPDSLHGLLVLEEMRNPLSTVADVAGLRSGALASALHHARTGHAGRVPFYAGERHTVPPDQVPRGIHSPRNMLFLNAWQRRAITMMLANGGASTVELKAMLDKESIFVDVGPKMRALRPPVRRAGFDFQTLDGNKPTARYLITGDDAVTAWALIERGWAAE